MSMSLKELKSALETAINTQVDKVLVEPYYVNLRYVEGEVKKLHKTAMAISTGFKKLYSESYESEKRGKPIDVQNFLSEVISANRGSFGEMDNYVEATLTKLQDSLPVSHSPETKALIQRMVAEIDKLIAAPGGKDDGGLRSARTSILGVRSSNILAEINTAKEYSSNLALCASYSDDAKTRSSEGAYASSLYHGLDVASKLLPPAPKKDANEATPFDFTGHDVIFTCPGLKQSAAFIPIMNRINDFAGKNRDLDFMKVVELKRPFIGQGGRDIESIVNGIIKNKAKILGDLDASRTISEDRKTEIRKEFVVLLRNTLLELKTTFRTGASYVASPAKQSTETSLSM
ncbi:hypothetical protein RYA05_01015 [Pseudomonas syringae pv. actinidiae]|nr:hypothetical protein [Pseudomonas syringae pv. actinidiae]